MIPLAIAIGIIEDKIANDLTGNKSTKEHLEELKEKFKNHSKQKYNVDVCLKETQLAEVNGELRFIKNRKFGGVSNIEVSPNFVVIRADGNATYIRTDNVDEIYAENENDFEKHIEVVEE